MKYDLRTPLHRKQFVAYCNRLLKNKCAEVTLTNSSKRTVDQNRYMHVLIRILAAETGVTEDYAKAVYFKEYANSNIFSSTATDPLTGKTTTIMRSSASLTVPEMTKALDNFRDWAADNGYYLPDATIDDKGNVSFKDEQTEEVFKQAEIETDRLEKWL